MFYRTESFCLSKSKSKNKSDECEELEIVAEVLETKEEQPQAKQETRKFLYQVIAEIYHEYCSNTSIHGIQYLGEQRPLKEKIFWLCVFFMSIYSSTDLIRQVYLKWEETPVIVSLSEKSIPVWSIPFPAITICSETKRVPKENATTFAKLLHELEDCISNNLKFEEKNITADELQQFRTLLQICNPQLIAENMPLLSSNSIQHWDVLDAMLPNFARHFFYCSWFNNFGECEQFFERSYTEEGICYTFNGLKATDLYRANTFQHQRMQQQNETVQNYFTNRTLMWSLQNGYERNSGVKTYPARVLGAGTRTGFFVALQSFKHELDYGCRGAVQGFKVILHAPDDVPHVALQFVRIPMAQEISIAIKPNMITTSAGIADYHPKRRQCFLHNERLLKFFKIYTQANCKLECLANFTLSKCGCVKFSMPRSLDTPVCDETKIHCFDAAQDELQLQEFTREMQQENARTNAGSEAVCDCMPACTSLSYNVEISQGSFDLEEMLKAAGDTEFQNEYPGSQMSRLSIYFKEEQFFTSKRSELYGITDFIANCGGIFGLFMGFSMLSMVELLYHFTLRLCSNFERMKNLANISK